MFSEDTSIRLSVSQSLRWFLAVSWNKVRQRRAVGVLDYLPEECIPVGNSISSKLQPGKRIPMYVNMFTNLQAFTECVHAYFYDARSISIQLVPVMITIGQNVV